MIDPFTQRIKENFRIKTCVLPDCTAKTYSDGLCSLHWAQRFSHVPDLTGPDITCKLCGRILRNAEEAKEKCRVKLGEIE